MLVLALLFALQGNFILGHMSDVHHGIHSNQVKLETTTIPDDAVSELHRSLSFYPPSLDFGAWAIGKVRSHIVTLINKNTNRSVYLSSISGKTPAFYSSFFEDKVVPPQGNTTFNVVFLPRSYGNVETNLLIHTSFGQAKLPVKGEGRECPYRLEPLVGFKAPYNATITPEIHMYNPHSKPIQILEVYSSGGQFQLELPSGGQEGPQALWEIPAYSSKPIIRIRFHGSQPGNHTAYIRVKISDTDDDHKDHVLVIPVEFEILTNSGMYSPSPILNFGKVTSKDEAQKLKVSLLNSGKDKLEIIEYKLKNVNGLIEIQKSDLTLILNSQQALENTFINGQLIITTQNKQAPNQIMELSINIRAEIYRGFLEFKKNLTVFITGAKNYTKEERSFMVQNKFTVPVAITNLTIENNDTTIFKIINFQPIILQPGEEKNVFKIFAINESANFITSMKLETNLTIYEFPIVVCTGLLQRYTSIDSEQLSLLSDDRTLDFGIVPFGDFSHFGYIVMKNPNPIPIQLLKWNFTNPRGVYYQSMFLGCIKQSDLNEDNKIALPDRFNLCLNITSSDIAAFKLAVQSYHVKSITGVFTIWTEIEQIATVVKFVTVMGRLEVDQSRLHFNDCFPGKRCSADISIHSTFLKTMRVNSIKVSVPGLVFEYHTQNGLPEISANSITDIGRIHFDPKSVCSKKCYIPQEGDDSYRKDNMEFSEIELRKRTENFRRFKWNLQTITFTLNTSEVRLFEFNTTVDIIWPKLVKGPQTLPPTEIGQMYEGFIYIKNPSSRTIKVEINLSDPKKAKMTSLSLPLEVVDVCVFCYLTDENVFSLAGPSTYIIKPNLFIAVPIAFLGHEAKTYSTLLHIKNNLTLYEAVWVTAKAVQPQFRFGNRKPGSNTPLLFEINEKHLSSCENKASEEQVLVSTKRTFTARNSGEVPILVEAFQIADRECEGFGFKILDCESFELKINSTKKIDIAFTPDFTMTRISRLLTLKTNLSYSVNYTLLASIPASSLEQCSKALQRPFWEIHIKKISVGVLTVAFMFVLVAAFLDSDKVLKDHVQNMSKDKGPIHPPLDLRNIGMKNSSSDEQSPSICSGNNEKTLKNITSNSVKKRNIKRNNISIQNIPNRDKPWAEELAKKISSTEKSNSISSNPVQSEIKNSQTNSKLSQASPISTKTVKEDKQTPPKKVYKESQDSSIEKIPDKASNTPESDKKYEPSKTDSGQTLDIIKKPKILFKKTKTNQSPPCVDTPKEQPETVYTTDSTIDRLQKPLKFSKEKIDSQTTPNSKKNQSNQEYSLPLQFNDSPTQTESTPITKSNTSQRKYGKTPGRERKKEIMPSKRLEHKTPKFKGTAFQFSSPLVSNSANNTIWDTNQATFSHVVAQKPANSPDQISSNIQKSLLDQQDSPSNGHDWNEADLKNHETFGTDIETKQNSIDLGPIGTRKSPSLTPVWEPLQQNIHRPTPNISTNTNNTSFFSSNFPIAATLEYTNDNQYLGGASGLLDHLITESQQHRCWQPNDILLSLLQQREQQAPIGQCDWPLENRMWTPMGYQDEPQSLIPDPLSVWQRPQHVRPPPGLELPKRDSPIHHPETVNQTLPARNIEHEENLNEIPPFDPFNSLSSIWSDPWTKTEKK